MSQPDKENPKLKADVKDEDVEVKNQYRPMFDKTEEAETDKLEQIKDAAKEKIEQIKRELKGE